MDKEEVEDLIKKCFEADNNGEINFLSFWAGQYSIDASGWLATACVSTQSSARSA